MMHLAQSQTDAAWFQAYGSIAAIVFSVAVGVGAVLLQQGLSDKASKREEKTALTDRRVNADGLFEAIINLADGIKMTVNRPEVDQSVGWRGMLTGPRTTLRHLIVAVARVDVVSLERPALWNEWALLLHSMEMLSGSLDDEIAWASRFANAVPIEDRKPLIAKRLQEMRADAVAAREALDAKTLKRSARG